MAVQRHAAPGHLRATDITVVPPGCVRGPAIPADFDHRRMRRWQPAAAPASLEGLEHPRRDRPRDGAHERLHALLRRRALSPSGSPGDGVADPPVPRRVPVHASAVPARAPVAAVRPQRRNVVGVDVLELIVERHRAHRTQSTSAWITSWRSCERSGYVLDGSSCVMKTTVIRSTGSTQKAVLAAPPQATSPMLAGTP